MLRLVHIKSFSDFYEECKEEFLQHYSFCEDYKSNKVSLNINIEMFQQLISTGVMNIFKIYDEDIYVGYINVTISLNPLFNKPQAVVDFLHIIPEQRRCGYAEKTILELEKELKQEGVYDFNIQLPDKDYSESFAGALGYTKTSIIFSKYLGE